MKLTKNYLRKLIKEEILRESDAEVLTDDYLALKLKEKIEAIFTEDGEKNWEDTNVQIEFNEVDVDGRGAITVFWGREYK